MMTLNKKESVFLCIDIQEKLMAAICNADEVIRNQKILFEMSKELDLPIIVTEQYPRGLGETIEELKALWHDEVKVIEKTSFGTPPQEMLDMIERNKRRQIIIAGVETHICVYQMSRELRKLGYQVMVVGDACGSRTVENDKSGKDLIWSSDVVVSNTESVLYDLLKESGTPEFKKLSPLIK